MSYFQKNDLSKELLKEYSKKQCIRIVQYVGNDADRLAELVNVFLGGPYRITQRAAWPLSYCVQKHPELIIPHLKTILKFTGQEGAPDAVKRNVMRFLQFMSIPKKYQGATLNLCLRFLSNKKEAVAVRVFAMTVLANLSKELPELKNELIPLIEDEMPYASAGFRSRGKRLLKELLIKNT
ncbi:MAG: hypothetical protein JST69_00070 [Bacteroidetes bacterium]|nr:hypothetical protein [Bacteroidota bacterium]